MVTPAFIFDTEADGYISDPFTVFEQAKVHIELASRAPVVTLKEEPDGSYSNYGQSPKESDRYEINLTSKDEIKVRMAAPVEVTKCYIIN